VAAAATTPLSGARVAIVHDWLVTPGGAELVLAELLAIFPQAEVFTLIDKRGGGAGTIGPRTHTSALQYLPGIGRYYRSCLPLMPLAMRGLDVRGYDIVISNSHAIAKGVRTSPRQLHVCYCLSPMRYAWDLRDQYLREAELERGLRGALARTMLERMRRWDEANTAKVDAFSTLSVFIGDRIRRAYGRSAEVIYPPVDTDYFTPPSDGMTTSRDRGVYVTASRFVPYKRIDLIAHAFTSLLPDCQLVIAGDGPDEAKVRASAGANVLLAGRLPRESLRELLRRARAFVFAAEEDFGIAPVEAMACGTPVVAFGKGGVTETVRGLDDAAPTGVFFGEQTAVSLAGAVRRLEALEQPIAAEQCRARALEFRAERFRRQFSAFVEDRYAAFVERRFAESRPA